MENSNGTGEKSSLSSSLNTVGLSRGLAVSRQEGIDKFLYLNECVPFGHESEW